MAGDAERSDEFEREVLSAINPALAVVGFWGATLEKVSDKRSSIKPNTCWWAACGLVGLWAAVVMLVADGADCPPGTLKKKKRKTELIGWCWSGDRGCMLVCGGFFLAARAPCTRWHASTSRHLTPRRSSPLPLPSCNPQGSCGMCVIASTAVPHSRYWGDHARLRRIHRGSSMGHGALGRSTHGIHHPVVGRSTRGTGGVFAVCVCPLGAPCFLGNRRCKKQELAR